MLAIPKYYYQKHNYTHNIQTSKHNYQPNRRRRLRSRPVEHGCEVGVDTWKTAMAAVDNVFIPSTMAAAAGAGMLHLVRILHKHGCVWDDTAPTAALRAD